MLINNYFIKIVDCNLNILFNSALSSESEKAKLLNEVSLMLSFKHPNVMSLIGLCFDGDVPLIIMPFMSDGSVLDYVRQNRGHLYFTQQSSEVSLLCSYLLYVYSHVCVGCKSSEEVFGYVPSDCKRNELSCNEEICSSRPGSQKLHVSTTE